MFTTLFDATAKIDSASSKKKTRKIDNFIAPEMVVQLSSNDGTLARAFFMRPALGAGFVPPRQR